jgi:CRISPR-associated protein Cmr1
LARQKLEVTLETVTPLFLAGADGKTPELRPASFRGAMRFWLRALLGGALGDDVEAVRREESRVFGSTAGASQVVVQTAALHGGLQHQERRPLPHSKRFRLPAFPEGSKFSLTLATRPDQQLPVQASAALLLMLNLGSVGKRSRRGFGSLQAIKVEVEGLDLPEDIESLLEEQPGDGQALVQHLTKAVSVARSFVNVNGDSPYKPDALPDYPILSSDHALVLVCKHAFPSSQPSYEQAMVDFWRRVLRHKDHRDDRAYGYANGGRRASPFILRLWYTKAGYHLVLTAFRSAPLPAGERGWGKVMGLLKACRENWQGEYIFGKGGW